MQLLPIKITTPARIREKNILTTSSHAPFESPLEFSLDSTPIATSWINSLKSRIFVRPHFPESFCQMSNWYCLMWLAHKTGRVMCIIINNYVRSYGTPRMVSRSVLSPSLLMMQYWQQQQQPATITNQHPVIHNCVKNIVCFWLCSLCSGTVKPPQDAKQLGLRSTSSK